MGAQEPAAQSADVAAAIDIGSNAVRMDIAQVHPDGHAEVHRWVDKSTLEISRILTEADVSSSPFNYPVNWAGGEGADITYMAKHYVPGEIAE